MASPEQQARDAKQSKGGFRPLRKQSVGEIIVPSLSSDSQLLLSVLEDLSLIESTKGQKTALISKQINPEEFDRIRLATGSLRKRVMVCFALLELNGAKLPDNIRRLLNSDTGLIYRALSGIKNSNGQVNSENIVGYVNGVPVIAEANIGEIHDNPYISVKEQAELKLPKGLLPREIGIAADTGGFLAGLQRPLQKLGTELQRLRQLPDSGDLLQDKDGQLSMAQQIRLLVASLLPNLNQSEDRIELDNVTEVAVLGGKLEAARTIKSRLSCQVLPKSIFDVADILDHGASGLGGVVNILLCSELYPELTSSVRWQLIREIIRDFYNRSLRRQADLSIPMSPQFLDKLILFTNAGVPIHTFLAAINSAV